ncbi:MAG: beta-propeller domain-containing protein [Proteobacteria bacterium]|nr:beta-propeller domain-containing protein [Pseudomonadota bacterium]MBU1687625.1 beta-propeller domain-containing protein [Pseudomonadota bacterium]
MKTTIPVLFLLLLLLGCHGSGAPTATDPSTSDSFQLVRIANEEELTDQLKQGITKRTGATSSWEMDTSAPVASNGNEAGGSDQTTTSTTNLQVSGVDEADSIKSDGTYLYQLVSSPEIFYYGGIETGGVAIDPATPTTNSDPFAPVPTSDTGNKVRILRMLSQPTRTELVTELSLGSSNDPRTDGLYLVTGRSAQQPDLLITLAGRTSNWQGMWFEPWYWSSGKTQVTVINVSDPTTPTTSTTLELDGSLISSRRIEETLYLITRYQPGLTGYQPYPYTTEQIAENQRLVGQATLDDLLPGYSVNSGPDQPLVEATACYGVPSSTENELSGDLITITAIDLADPEHPVSQCLVGATETIFVSSQSLYLASTRYQYDQIIALDDQVGSSDGTVITSTPPTTPPSIASLTYPETVYTDLHKFSLSAITMNYRGSATVAGHLGWEQDKKSFRLGEENDVLGVVTSTGETWLGNASTHLTMLKESGDNATLAMVSELPNSTRSDPIGKTGENLYAARFLGNRLYLVTFLVTDPLYAIDLTDPADPVILGELSIPGYSDYLHPVNENLLLGIGKDAQSSGSDGDGRGAWYQGIKIALFDVSQPAAPVAIDTLTIGKRGSDSTVLSDHHGFSFLQGADGIFRFAMPLSRNDGSPSYGDPTEPWTYYNWSDTGLGLFEINGEGSEATLTHTGTLVVETATSTGSYPTGSLTDDRSVLTTDGVYYSHNGMIWSADWLTPMTPLGPE